MLLLALSSFRKLSFPKWESKLINRNLLFPTGDFSCTFCLMGLSVLDSSYKWNHTIYALLWLVSLTYYCCYESVKFMFVKCSTDVGWFHNGPQEKLKQRSLLLSLGVSTRLASWSHQGTDRENKRTCVLCLY